MTTTPLTTDVELAEMFGIPLPKLHELRKRYGWPCVRLGRFNIRFTAEQITEILVQQTEAPARPPRDQVRVTVPGQSAKSAARRRSA